jgi:hypothetical protein
MATPTPTMTTARQTRKKDALNGPCIANLPHCAHYPSARA